MATNAANEILQHLRRAVLRRDLAGQTDGQLLGAFIEHRDEMAFAALVQRHGPMVLGVCRRILRDQFDVEDAFQATFLVLVRKAGSVVPRERVASWLFGVAHQTAIRLRALNAKRQSRERQGGEMPEPKAVPRNGRDDLQPLLDRVLSRMPDRYRLPIVLCDLEGKTRKEAALQLGWPEGSLSSRLARARVMLAKRLTQQGVVLSGGSLAALLTQNALSAPLPTPMVSSVLGAASLWATGRGTAVGVISARVAALTNGVLNAMMMTKLTKVMLVLLAATLLAFSAGKLIIPAAVATAADGEQQMVSPRAAPASEKKSPTVQVRIGSPPGMKVWVLHPTGQARKGLTAEAPGRLTLEQGKCSRLKLAGIPNRPGTERFPTVEILPGDPVTRLFVTTSAIPIDFTDDDFDQVDNGKTITRVIYLKSLKAGRAPRIPSGEVAAMASYDHPGRDVIAEAKRRGSILAVVRMGNIDLKPAHAGKEHLPLSRSKKDDKPVEIVLGDDGIRGRLIRVGKKDPKDFDKKSLLLQLEDARRALAEAQTALASLQARQKAMKDQLDKATLEIRSLQDTLARKEMERRERKKASEPGRKDR